MPKTDYEADYLPNALRCRPVVILGLLSWPPFFIMIPSIIILFELNSIKHAISAITLCLIIMAWLESNCTSVFEKPLISKMLVMVAKALSAVSQSHFSGGGGGSPRRRQWRPLHRKLECFLVSLRCQHWDTSHLFYSLRDQEALKVSLCVATLNMVNISFYCISVVSIWVSTQDWRKLISMFKSSITTSSNPNQWL